MQFFAKQIIVLLQKHFWYNKLINDFLACKGKEKILRLKYPFIDVEIVLHMKIH